VKTSKIVKISLTQFGQGVEMVMEGGELVGLHEEFDPIAPGSFGS